MGSKDAKTLVEFLLSRLAKQELELINLRDENARLTAKRMGKKALYAYVKTTSRQKSAA
jgi:hypothetical protein